MYCSTTLKNKLALAGHQRFCSKNPNREITWSAKQAALGIRPAHFDDPKYIEKQRLRTAAHLAACQSPEARERSRANAVERYKDPKEREKHSLAMKDAVLRNIDSYTKKNVVGRVKNIDYNGTTLKGSWELVVAETLDHLHLTWTQPTTGIEYSYEDRTHLYFPDFYVPSLNVFIEVKGYERARDLAKWKAVPNLVVLKESAIKRIKRGETDWLVDFLTKNS